MMEKMIPKQLPLALGLADQIALKQILAEADKPTSLIGVCDNDAKEVA